MRLVFAVLPLLLLETAALGDQLGVEVRTGPALHHLRVQDTFAPFNSGRIEDAAVELFWSPPVDLSVLGSPRLQVGGTFNFLGYENMVHVNLSWHAPLFRTPFYVEGGLGGAYATGYLHNPPPGFNRLGCHTLFYFEIGVGVQLPNDWTATLTDEHESHAWLCGQDNQALNSMSIQIGHEF